MHGKEGSGALGHIVALLNGAMHRNGAGVYAMLAKLKEEPMCVIPERRLCY